MDILVRDRQTPSGLLQAWYAFPDFTRPDLAEAVVDDLLAFVASREGLVEDLADGMAFRFGWSTITLQASEEGFVLCEPDFSGGAGVVDHVSVTAQITAMQRWVNERARAPFAPCLYSDTLMMPEGALDADAVVLVRAPRMHEGHSGWMLSPREPIAAGMQEVPTWMLLGHRPEILKALALPEGVIGAFEGGGLVSVRDLDNTDRWPPRNEGGEPGWLAARE